MEQSSDDLHTPPKNIMIQTAIDKLVAINAEEEEAIAALKAKNAGQVAALKAEAVSELLKNIAAIEHEWKRLSLQFKALTGKTLKRAKVASVVARPSSEQKEALTVKLLDSLKAAAKAGLSMGEIVEVGETAGATTSSVRDAVRDAMKSQGIQVIAQKGSRAAARYFAT